MTRGSFPHDNFSSVYWIFTKLDHMITLWKGKNPIYFGVIRSKVKVTITINIIFYRLIIYIDGRILWCTHFLFAMLGDIDLIFGIWVYNNELQIKFTFRSGPMIFGRVMALGLWNLAKYLVVTTFFRYAWRYWLDFWYVSV